MIRRLQFLLPFLILSSCTCGGGGGPDPSSGGEEEIDDSTYEFDLVEATGEWSVTGTAKSSDSCVNTTTLSKNTISLDAPIEEAASFIPSAGLFLGRVGANLTLGKRQGTSACGTQMRACPTSAGEDYTYPAFIVFKPLNDLAKNPAKGVAFIPVLEGLELPDLCRPVSFVVSPAHLRAKPITVAQLKSGRFVLEAQATLPMQPKTRDLEGNDPAELSGTLTYSFRFVFQSKTFNPSNEVAAPELKMFDECLVDSEPSEDDLEAVETAFDNGETDIPLIANGCRRLKVVRTADSLVMSHEITRDTKLVYDSSNGTSHAERDAVVTYVREKDGAGIRERFDTNHDGFFESTTETLFSGGVWLSTTTRELQPGSGALVRQTSRTRVDAATVSVKIEEGGQLVDEYISATEQKKCFKPTSEYADGCKPDPDGGSGGGGQTPTCGGKVTKCSKSQRRSLMKKLNSALKKGTDCLADAGFDGFQPADKGLTMLPTNQINLLCSTNPCDPYGYYRSEMNEDGTNDFMVNVSKNNSVELARTMFHEMLHSDARFTHNDDLVGAAARACKLQLADRTYACETMCFNPKAGGSCACNRCLNPGREPKQEVCDKCSKFGACPGRRDPGPNGTTTKVSQAVGAYCARMKTFCDTKSECDGECAAIGNSCTPVKSTCDKNCN